jgi:hypothetical protein
MEWVPRMGRDGEEGEAWCSESWNGCRAVILTAATGSGNEKPPYVHGGS